MCCRYFILPGLTTRGRFGSRWKLQLQWEHERHGLTSDFIIFLKFSTRPVWYLEQCVFLHELSFHVNKFPVWVNNRKGSFCQENVSDIKQTNFRIIIKRVLHIIIKRVLHVFRLNATYHRRKKWFLKNGKI